MQILQLQQQIIDLQTKFAFQEQLLEELNQALINQQFLVDKLQVQLRYTLKKLQNLQLSNIASLSEETLPPHY